MINGRCSATYQAICIDIECHIREFFLNPQQHMFNKKSSFQYYMFNLCYNIYVFLLQTNTPILLCLSTFPMLYTSKFVFTLNIQSKSSKMVIHNLENGGKGTAPKIYGHPRLDFKQFPHK